MQANRFLTYLISMSVLVGVTACRKNHPAEPSLPPLTAEGKNTFGCKINGAIFLPKSKFLSSPITCAYQKLYSGPDGFVFVVGANYSRLGSCEGSTVGIYLDSISLKTGNTYPLKARGYRETGKHEGLYLTSDDCGTTARDFVTEDSVTGEVTITHFDASKGIAAGTFWFDAVDELSDTVHITEGRFDMEYTD